MNFALVGAAGTFPYQRRYRFGDDQRIRGIWKSEWGNADRAETASAIAAVSVFPLPSPLDIAEEYRAFA
jgi:hypothetical protein